MLILKHMLTFDSDTKHWYIEMCVCVCVCVYTLQVIIFIIFWLAWSFVFVSIRSN